MSDFEDSRSGVFVREKMKPVYFVVPCILTGVFFLLFLVLKLAEKSLNGFMRWGWVFGSVFIFGLLSFGISSVIYLFLSQKDGHFGEARLLSRERCDKLMRGEIRNRTGFNLGDFSHTADSVEGVAFFGVGGELKLYYHLYRIENRALKRYFLGVMNMLESDSDDITWLQVPSNFSDVRGVVNDYGNMMCKSPIRSVVKESVFRDEVSGRSRVDKEESPLDAPEDSDVEYPDVGGQRG